MQAHASVITSGNTGKRILNVGFGMGIIDGILQDKFQPSLHIIIEAHPDVYQRMVDDGWEKRPNVRICFGRWQDWMPKLAKEEEIHNMGLDGIFFDTYGEHFLDLEDFQLWVGRLLARPHGVYSFFNGLAPDNLFFHGVGELNYF